MHSCCSCHLFLFIRKCKGRSFLRPKYDTSVSEKRIICIVQILRMITAEIGSACARAGANFFAALFKAALVRQLMQYMASPSMYLLQLRHLLECVTQQFVSPEEAILLLQPERAHFVVGVPYLFVKEPAEAALLPLAALVKQLMQYMASPSMYLLQLRHLLECVTQQFVSPEEATLLLQPGCAHLADGVP